MGYALGINDRNLFKPVLWMTNGTETKSFKLESTDMVNCALPIIELLDVGSYEYEVMAIRSYE